MLENPEDPTLLAAFEAASDNVLGADNQQERLQGEGKGGPDGFRS